MTKLPLIWPLVVCVVSTCRIYGVHAMDEHGGVKMGVSNHKCDDAKTNLTVDGDYRDERIVKEFQCIEDKYLPVRFSNTSEYCQEQTDRPLHVCMTEAITYTDSPPLSGAHRPLWPVYGEYVYLPPQRWLHSLEHGAIVVLYHPCVDLEELRRLTGLVRSCIRRHIITPYRGLSKSQPLALLSWGCKMTMNYVDDKAVIDFIKTHGISPAPEAHVYRDGQYSYGLTKKAEIVSDIRDSDLCPFIEDWELEGEDV